jgi:predicted nuclease with TOPRIM domain
VESQAERLERRGLPGGQWTKSREKGGDIMEVKDYCGNVVTELTGWKARMYDVVRQLDKKSTGEKEKFAPQINEIHMIIEELCERIEKLQKECPTEWKPDEKEINARVAKLKDKMKDVWDPLHIGV